MCLSKHSSSHKPSESCWTHARAREHTYLPYKCSQQHLISTFRSAWHAEECKWRAMAIHSVSYVKHARTQNTFCSPWLGQQRQQLHVNITLRGIALYLCVAATFEIDILTTAPCTDISVIIIMKVNGQAKYGEHEWVCVLSTSMYLDAMRNVFWKNNNNNNFNLQ